MEKVKLKDLGEICTGNTPSKKNKEFYKSNDICFFKPSDIDEDNIKLLNNSEEYISEMARNKARILPKGTILVTCIGTIGKIGILEKESACNQQINAIIPNNRIDGKYLAYLIYSKKMYLQKKANAPVVPIINKTDFSNIELDIYDKSSQIKIANELDKAQEIIDIRKKQLEQFDELIKSQFVEMFEKNINDSFKKCRIGEIYKFQYGKGNNIPENKGEYPCFGSNGQVGYHTEYNNEDAPIIGHIGAYAGVVNWASGKHFVTYNGVMCFIKNKDIVNPLYGYYMLKMQDFENTARRGVAQPFVSYDMLEAPEIYLPPIDLQNQFAEFVKQIDKQKFKIQKSLEEIQLIEASLMNKYFGE